MAVNLVNLKRELHRQVHRRKEFGGKGLRRVVNLVNLQGTPRYLRPIDTLVSRKCHVAERIAARSAEGSPSSPIGRNPFS